MHLIIFCVHFTDHLCNPYQMMTRSKAGNYFHRFEWSAAIRRPTTYLKWPPRWRHQSCIILSIDLIPFSCLTFSLGYIIIGSIFSGAITTVYGIHKGRRWHWSRCHTTNASVKPPTYAAIALKNVPPAMKPPFSGWCFSRSGTPLIQKGHRIKIWVLLTLKHKKAP